MLQVWPPHSLELQPSNTRLERSTAPAYPMDATICRARVAAQAQTVMPRPKMTLGRLALAVSASVVACHSAQLTSSGLQAGTFSLQEASSYQRPGLIPGEGSAIEAATILLRGDQTFTGTAVVAFTDSGTVTDTITVVNGQWIVRKDSIYLSYGWLLARWSDTIRPDTVVGPLAPGGFILPRFAIVSSAEDLDLYFAATP